MPLKVNRRDWLGQAAVALGSSVGVGVVGEDRSEAPLLDDATIGVAPARTSGTSIADAAALLEPLGPDSVLGRWHLRKIGSIVGGSASLVLSDARGVSFQLDIYARDTEVGAPRPPGRSEKFDVFLANGGTGKLSSREDHGLAAMAVADVLRQNEALLDCSGFVTLRTRLSQSPDGVRRLA
jgi:hypothetical protein